MPGIEERFVSKRALWPILNLGAVGSLLVMFAISCCLLGELYLQSATSPKGERKFMNQYPEVR